MPFRPEHSLLNVNLEKMHTIDTRSVENLFGLWAVFSKTSDALEDGKRLENLSWRLWNRETFCCCPEQTKSRPQPQSTLSPQCQFPPRASTSSIPKEPELASSFDTVSSCDSDDAADSSLLSPPPPNVVRPELTRLDTCESRSRGREKHITPDDLEKMVVSIKQKQILEPLEPLPLPASTEPEQIPHTPVLEQSVSEEQTTPLQQHTQSTIAPQESSLIRKNIESSASTVATSNDSADESNPPSDESSSTAISAHSVVRGFVPGGAPSSYRSQTHLAAQPTPILKNSPRAQASAASRKKPAMFTLGTSSGEDESSLDSNMYKGSMGSVAHGLRRPSSHGKKQASFRDENLVTKVQDSPVFESDDEDDDEEAVSEGVFEDDEDSSDWEDEGDDDKSDEGGPSYFQRVDSRPDLTSHRSLLTSLMHEGDRAKAMQNAASRSTPALRRSRTTSPNGPSLASSPQRDQRESLLAANTRGNSRAQPIIMTTSNSQQLALSPRTTRRNMLSSELTESLRRNLLWERQHKSSQNLAAIKRRHTSTDVKNLKQHPEPTNLSATANKSNFNNDYFHAGLGEFHSKGW